MIKKCDCGLLKGNRRGAEYQDQKYGYGNRVHNPCNNGVRCTICGKEKVAGSDDKKKKGK